MPVTAGTTPHAASRYRSLSAFAAFAVVVVLLFCLALDGIAASAGRYGKPLKFDAPPVDLNYNSSGADASASPPRSTPPAQVGRAVQSKPAQQPAKVKRTVTAAPGPGAVAEAEEAPPAQDEGASAAAASGPTPIRLFGTVEFRGPVKNLPKWERVQGSENRQPSFGSNEQASLTKDIAARWGAVRDKLQGASLMEQAKGVNSFFNQWPYKTDIEVWGVEDYWETPSEFVKKSGDCEDYAIAKYYALRNLGVPASNLRIVALKDTIRNIGHAVTVVYVNDDAYILDNLTNLVLSHKRLSHYAPQYSVNEEFLWRHIKPKSGPTQ